MTTDDAPPAEWLARPVTFKPAAPGGYAWRLMQGMHLVAVVTEQHHDVFINGDCSEDAAFVAVKTYMDIVHSDRDWGWDRFQDGRQWQTGIICERSRCDLRAEWADEAASVEGPVGPTGVRF
jgi:hypothetical protein